MTGLPRRIAFQRIAAAALAAAPQIVSRWLSNGRREGPEWVAVNPTRADHRPGSFKVNLNTGLWADFAANQTGRDLIGLAAYLFNMSQVEAAKAVADMLGIDPYDN